jgi:hypothetical protein
LAVGPLTPREYKHKRNAENQTNQPTQQTIMDIPPILFINGLCTLAGAVIGFIGAWAINAKTQRMNHERHLRELGLQIAVTNFKLAHSLIERLPPNCTAVAPTLPVYVAEGIRVAEIVSNPRLTAFEIGKAIAGLGDFTSTIQKGADAAKQPNKA